MSTCARRRAAAVALGITLVTAGFAWGPSIWLIGTTESKRLANPAESIFEFTVLQGSPIPPRPIGELRVHRWRRDARGQPLPHGPFWIRWAEGGPYFQTGRYENGDLVRISQHSPAGEIVLEWRLRGLNVEEERNAPPWFGE